VFSVAALVLLVTPGPAVLHIVTRSVDQGRRAGLISMLGVHVGTLVHAAAAAAAGLSALLAASATGRWRGNPRFLSGQRWVSGGTFIGLGVAAALSSGNRK